MNHLHLEKSPYLLQHINNPVDWYPWAETTFEIARAENKLIFLSIGYSTCHWCHVMAHECFEDSEVAQLLNQNYISVKVDREERPDIDQVYMEVCQRLTGSGGWPLSIVMMPDAQPFYAATYIPKEGRQGRPGLMDLLPWITTKWQQEPDFLRNAALEIVGEMKRPNSETGKHVIGKGLFAKTLKNLKMSYDRRHGGFGNAPKFPRPHDLTFLLHQYSLSGDEECLEMAEQSLLKMRSGGLYDQLGYGFHRYSTDEKWLVPHFEKMLYDQAGLVMAYLDAWHVTGHEVYDCTVREVLTYLVRDMTSPEGAFYSAEDADSEGVEGKFYLWPEVQIDELLDAGGQAFRAAYNVTENGNYHDEVTGKATGDNILHLSSKSADELLDTIQDDCFIAGRKSLFAEREKRPRPHLDDKIITAWNGMMISAMAEAGRTFGEREYIARASRAADFILTTMRDEEGRLFRRYRQGDVAIPAFSEDYAFLARSLLDLYGVDFDAQRLLQAIALAQQLRRFFQNPDTGRLYDTPTDGEKLLIRPSSSFDGATPSASSVALDLFARLFLLTGDVSWRESAEQLLKALAIEVNAHPAGYCQLLQAASWLLLPTREIVIVGVPGESSTEAMLSVVRNSRLLQTVVLYKPANEPELVSTCAPFSVPMGIVNGLATAYVCENFACREPLTDCRELQNLLNPEQ